MTTDFSTFFNSFVAMPSSSLTSQPGYTTNNFDVLNQKMGKQQSVGQSNLLDYSYLQTDKNFNPTILQTTLHTLVGQLGISTQQSKMTNFQWQVLGQKEYTPTNVQNSLYNTQSLKTSNVNTLPAVQQGATDKSFSTSLGSDLTTQYKSGNLLLSDFLAISALIGTLFAAVSTVGNTAISTALNSTVSSFAPSSLTDVTSTIQYQDAIANSGMSPDDQTTFNDNLNAFLMNSSNQEISTMVTAENYQNVIINLSDPVGISVATALVNEVSTTFTNNLNDFLSTQPDSGEVADVIIDDFSTNINNGISQAVPNMSTVVNGVNSIVTNNLGAQIKTEFDNVLSFIMTDLGVIAPIGTTQSKIDLLYNLHRNIDLRQQLLTNGGNTTQIEALDDGVASYFVSGGYNSTTLSILEKKMAEFVGQ